MKTTVYQEWLTNRLVPWYHYIPINYDYSDIYSVLLYFFGLADTGQPAHDGNLRAIGERSRDWAESQLGWEQHKVRTNVYEREPLTNLTGLHVPTVSGMG